VTCTEDVSRILPGEIARETDGTYLGDSRVREQMRRAMGGPAGIAGGTTGSRPVGHPSLSPLRNARSCFATAFRSGSGTYLPNSLHVVAPGAHVPRGPCIDSMERAFLEAGLVAPSIRAAFTP